MTIAEIKNRFLNEGFELLNQTELDEYVFRYSDFVKIELDCTLSEITIFVEEDSKVEKIYVPMLYIEESYYFDLLIEKLKEVNRYTNLKYLST